MTGILPTISLNELQMDYMTPAERYYLLNDRMREVRGTDFNISIRGVDEISIKHSSVLFEACNTSFQMHLQVPPQDFVSSYNWAQAISGPVLAISTNSPLLLGRELWAETRIALFQQSIDTRFSSYALKNQIPRVTYGNDWAEGSILDIYRRDVARHKSLISMEIVQNSLDALEGGEIPPLQALRIFNGTIYRWNRPCFGLSDGRPHLRIENRYIPAGPSVADQMANFAFWIGLMKGRPREYDHMARVMDFRDAKQNFNKAAHYGKESVMYWGGRQISARDLIIQELLPIAEKGLKNCGIDEGDAQRYLDIIRKRTESFTGSQWMVRNFRYLNSKLKTDDALTALTKAIYHRQRKNLPVHTWTDIEDQEKNREQALLVNHVMSTQLVSVNEYDLAEFAINLMQWENIHHLPVVNERGDLTGLLTWTHINRFHATDRHGELSVSEIMTPHVLTVKPETDIKTAIRMMKRHEYGCLPVVSGHELVGIITIDDVKIFDHD